MHKKVKIKNIKPNPFRNIARYPIREDKVAALIKSFQQTGVWPVILGREVGNFVEIPFGHHRKEAWERTMKPNDEIEINIMALSDTDMLKMMASENMEEWGTTALIEIETVAAVVKAYAEGKIELNGLPAKAKGIAIRYAPSFVTGSSPTRGDHPYSAESIANFLGWTRDSGRVQDKIYTALSALELIELKILTEDHFEKLGSRQALELVSETKARLEEREAEARDSEKKALEAKERQKTASTLHEKRLAEEQERHATERATKSRERGKQEAAQVGKHLASGMREGRITTTQASAEASKVIGLPKQDRELRGINSAARQQITQLDKMLYDDRDREKLDALVRDANYIDVGVRDSLVGALEALADRALGLARKLQPVTTKIVQAKTETKLLENG